VIDIKLLESSGTQPSYADLYRDSLRNRGENPDLVDQALALNQKRKVLITRSEQLKSSQNRVSQEIAIMKRAKQDASAAIAEMQMVSAEVKGLIQQVGDIEAEVHSMMLRFPNICHHSVPVGKSEEDNKIVRQVGSPRAMGFTPKEHGEIGEALLGIDFARAGKVTGARFAFLRGPIAKLSRALTAFMLDLHTQEHGYEEILPPFMVNYQSMQGTGQFPKFVDEAFHVEGTDFYLIPTAEVPVTNYFSGEMLSEGQLPTSFVAYSPCFRAEAGSHGKDTKGLIRQHQFEKVELLKFVHPDHSHAEHEKLTAHAEEILKRLELPYQVVALCTADLGFSAAKCYDIEVWLPGQGTYREISSCSNFEDFQARRANIRFRPEGGGKPRFVHTLNGSGLAVGRTLIAVIENNQQEDGSVLIPKVLRPYMGGQEEIRIEAN
jgi:seryl-tRNA synthetase